MVVSGRADAVEQEESCVQRSWNGLATQPVQECCCAILESLDSSVHTKLQQTFEYKPLTTNTLAAQAALAKHSNYARGLCFKQSQYWKSKTYKTDKLENDYLYYKNGFLLYKKDSQVSSNWQLPLWVENTTWFTKLQCTCDFLHNLVRSKVHIYTALNFLSQLSALSLFLEETRKPKYYFLSHWDRK